MMKKPQLRLVMAGSFAIATGIALGGHVFAGISYGPPPADLPAKVDALQQQMSALPAPYTDAKAAAASPVQSVNGTTGAVSVPVTQRQVLTDFPVPTADGVVTWTFPTPFTNLPSCYRDLAATATNYTFDDPLRMMRSKTAVSYKVTAHPKTLSIASLISLPITLVVTPDTVPAGTTLSLTCTAPM